jgi:ligand-binding sensor domain-containing protein
MSLCHSLSMQRGYCEFIRWPVRSIQAANIEFAFDGPLSYCQFDPDLAREPTMKLRRRTMAVVAVAALLSLAVCGIVAWRVERALSASRRDAAQKELLGVEERTLGAQPNPGFEGISAPAVFKSAALFQGGICLAGPAGLYAYSADGALEHIYRVGIDLPAAPLGQMAVGMLTGSRHPELLIATLGEGVLAFDGQNFRQIRARQDEARAVTALLPLGSGRLLIGTAKLGLLIYDGKTLKRFHPTTDNVYVTALAGSEAELWVGTLNDGLLYFNGGQTERIGEEQGLPDRRVEQIALSAGRAYAGTPMGVADVREGKVARVLAKGRYAHALMADGDSLLVGQIEEGVLRLPLSGPENNAQARRPIVAVGGASVDDSHPFRKDRGKDGAPSDSGTQAAAHNSAPGVTIEQFLAVGDTRYALANGGLLRREPDGEWRRIVGGGGAQLTDRDVSALLVASDGRLWVGYFDRGLDILSATGGEVQHVENEQVFCVNRIVEDSRRGAVVVATANGLVIFDRNGRQKQVLGREAGLIADHVTDVSLNNGGAAGSGMALATPAGITFLDDSGAHSIYAFQGLVNNHVYALGASGDHLVAGTLGGLSLLEGGSVRRNLNTATSGLKHNWITALAAVGNDWLVGTYGVGVMRLGADGSVTATEATRDGVVVNPTAMAADGRLTLAGTLGRGLMVGDATGTRWKTITAGLPSLNVTALAIHNGVVYVGTENGLVKISEDKL